MPICITPLTTGHQTTLSPHLLVGMEFLFQGRARAGAELGGRHSCEEILKVGEAGVITDTTYGRLTMCQALHPSLYALPFTTNITITTPWNIHWTLIFCQVLFSMFYIDHFICPYNNCMCSIHFIPVFYIKKLEKITDWIPCPQVTKIASGRSGIITPAFWI